MTKIKQLQYLLMLAQYERELTSLMMAFLLHVFFIVTEKARDSKMKLVWINNIFVDLSCISQLFLFFLSQTLFRIFMYNHAWVRYLAQIDHIFNAKPLFSTVYFLSIFGHAYGLWNLIWKQQTEPKSCFEDSIFNLIQSVTMRPN